MSRYNLTPCEVKHKQSMLNDAVYFSSRAGSSSVSSSSQAQPHDVSFGSLYSSIYGQSPYDDAAVAQRNKLYQSLLVQNRQEMVNRHSLCLKRLHEAAEEADALRRENSHLRCVNVELNRQLSQLIQKEIAASSNFEPRSPFGIVNGMRGLSIAETAREEDALCDQSPESVVLNEEAENIDVERFSLPKSISVRSNGYVKLPPPPAASSKSKAPRKSRAVKKLNASQKVYVPAGERAEVPVELEVYNQGMFKTELCNKWQESGDCPYKDHCQFAHGVEELRPVIRHPRYKTEVCRMVLAGVVCPYGHRCHFRHALTEEEKKLAAGAKRKGKPIR